MDNLTKHEIWVIGLASLAGPVLAGVGIALLSGLITF
jgi:hypothetical protein